MMAERTPVYTGNFYKPTRPQHPSSKGQQMPGLIPLGFLEFLEFPFGYPHLHSRVLTTHPPPLVPPLKIGVKENLKGAKVCCVRRTPQIGNPNRMCVDLPLVRGLDTVIRIKQDERVRFFSPQFVEELKEAFVSPDRFHYPPKASVAASWGLSPASNMSR